MTTLFEKIKVDQLNARKQHDTIATGLLTTLIGEAGRIGKDARNGDPTDEEVIKTIKGFLDKIGIVVTHRGESEQTRAESAILNGYLPTQLSATTIREIIIHSGIDYSIQRNIGAIMGLFKKNYAGQYDGAVVNAVIKNLNG